MLPWLPFVAAAFGAEVIGTMAGFGAATILTPVAAAFLDIKSSIALVAAFHLFGNLSRLFFFGRQADWRVWAAFGVPGIIASLAGAVMAAWLPGVAVRAAFGGFLLVYVASECLGSRWRLPPRRGTLIAGGLASGVVAGLLGTGGAIRSACLLAFSLPKEIYIGTSAAIALCVDATRLPVYVAKGLFPSALLPLLAALTVAAFAGSWVGQHLVRRISGPAFHRFVLGMLAVMGVKLLWEASRGLG